MSKDCGIRRVAILVVMLTVAAIGSRLPMVVEFTASAASTGPFVVYDATLYKNKPDLGLYGIRPIEVWYESQMFAPNQPTSALPVEQLVRSLARTWTAAKGPVVVDIERWPITQADPVSIQSTLGKFLHVLSWIRSEAPGIHVGVYGTVPVYDYWRAASPPMSPHYLEWQRDNARLEQLADHVDALYPSIYTFYPDRQAWIAYAKAQIAEARRLANGKPVYAFLWPQYHEANQALAHRFIEPDYWALQLTTMRQEADGIVIWGGWGDKGPAEWDEAAPWWQVTKTFMAHVRGLAPNPPTGLTVR